MSPELVTAIKERVAAGHTKEEIRSAVLALGHDEAVFNEAYALSLRELEQLVANSASPSLPSARSLVVDSFLFVTRRLDILLLTLVPSLAVFTLQYAQEFVRDSHILSLVLTSLTVVAAAVYIVTMVMALHLVCNQDSSRKDALVWTYKHFIPLLWISVVMVAVFFGGFVLFIVPGFILMILMYFGQYAYLFENQRGLSALIRSRELVRGRLGRVFWLLLSYMMALFIPLFFAMAIVLFAAELFPVLHRYAVLGELAVEVVSAVFGVMGFFAMAHVYKALQVGRSLTVPKKSQMILYAGIAGLGVIAIAAFVAAVVYFGDQVITDPISGDAELLKREIQSAPLAAGLHAADRGGSFLGVCEVLRPTITAADSVECNDSEMSWALSGNLGEERYCADTETSLKRVQSPLAERLSCLPLPESKE